jgi:hypothetical protein
VVDLVDLNAVRNHVGARGTTVPEPTPLLLGLLGGLPIGVAGASFANPSRGWFRRR